MPDPLSLLFDRLAVIREPPETARLVAAARANEVSRAWVEDGSLEHELQPYSQQLHGRVARRRFSTPEMSRTELGLDSAGAVVRFGEGQFLVTDASFVHRLVVRDGTLREVELGLLDHDGRVSDVLQWTTFTDRGVGEYWVTYRVTYGDDGLPAIMVEWYDSPGVSWVYRFVHDAGELVRVESLRFDEHDLPADREASIAAVLATIDDPDSAEVTWDAALRRREEVLPSPEEAFAALGGPLADAIMLAVDEAREGLGPLAFVSFSASPGWSIDDATLIRVTVADTAYRNRAREVVEHPLDVLSLMVFGETGGVAQPDVFAHCSEEVLQQVRTGQQATAQSYDAVQAAGNRLTTEIAQALIVRDWGDVDPAFLVVFGDRGREDHYEDWDDDEGWDEDEEEWEQDDEQDEWAAQHHLLPDVRREVGDARVDAFLQSLRPTAKRPKSRRSAGDRTELAALLVEQGMSEAEAALTAAASAWGIVLEGVQDEGDGSRLGGAPVLPDGLPWPDADGRPLTHLVTVACAELPDIENRDLLPADGHLAFFCDLSEDGLMDVVEPGDPRDILRIVHTPAQTPAHEPEPPYDDEPMAVRCRGLLQLPQWLPDLDAAALRILERVGRRINSPADDQLLGHPRTVQDDPRDPGEVNLLHFASVEFADGGALQFFGAADAIRAQDWDRIRLWGSSC